MPRWSPSSTVPAWRRWGVPGAVGVGWRWRRLGGGRSEAGMSYGRVMMAGKGVSACETCTAASGGLAATSPSGLRLASMCHPRRWPALPSCASWPTRPPAGKAGRWRASSGGWREPVRACSAPGSTLSEGAKGGPLPACCHVLPWLGRPPGATAAAQRMLVEHAIDFRLASCH